jgi:hypothetical protein
VTLGICVVLITITIAFELVKHHMEHNVPPMMSKIMQAMFGELTVLGFIALCAFLAIKFGVIANLSTRIYHDPEHLLHLFEDIHFMLFFVMIVFLFQVNHPPPRDASRERACVQSHASAHCHAVPRTRPTPACCLPAHTSPLCSCAPGVHPRDGHAARRGLLPAHGAHARVGSRA